MALPLPRPFSVARLARFELRRFRSPVARIALIFVLCVPLLYAAVYLSANWDPYGKLTNLPVAVVDLDRPASSTVDGKTTTLHAGRDFVTELVKQDSFAFTETTEQQAIDGLADGRYYLTITVPADFSAKLLTAPTTDPQQAGIVLRRNDANGFIAGSLAGQAQDKIAQAVNTAAIQGYFQTIFDNLATIRSGMADAADGAGRLATGLDSAQAGAGRLATGTAQAKTGADRLASGAGQLSTGITTADAGASQLATGASQLSTGITTADTGASRLAAGAGTLSAGIDSADAGAGRLAGGLGQLDDASSRLAKGAHQVADGTQQLDDTVLPPLKKVQQAMPAVQRQAGAIQTTVDQLAQATSTGRDSVSGQVDQISDSLAALAKAHPELKDDPRFAALTDQVDQAGQHAKTIATTGQQVASAAQKLDDALANGTIGADVNDAITNLTALNSGAQQVATGADQLQAGVHSASSGADTLSAGLHTAKTGAHSLATGAASLATGLHTAKTGARSLATGATSLATGLHTAKTGAQALATGATSLDSALGQLSTGATQLNTGLTTLRSGGHDLADGLTSGVAKIPDPTKAQADREAKAMSWPADVSTTIENAANYYGRGLAPMFFSIAMWVFGISAFLIVRAISPRALAARASSVRVALSAWLPVGTISAAGSMIMLAVVWVGLGLAPVHPWLLIGLTLLGSVCFSVIAHLLRVALGTTGAALLLIWLILQLVSSGGLYPAPLLPGFYAAVGRFMPMHYLIDGYRVVISGGLAAHLAHDALVLAVVTLVAMTLTVLVVIRRRQMSQRDLHPPLVAP